MGFSEARPRARRAPSPRLRGEGRGEGQASEWRIMTGVSGATQRFTLHRARDASAIVETAATLSRQRHAVKEYFHIAERRSVPGGFIQQPGNQRIDMRRDARFRQRIADQLAGALEFDALRQFECTCDALRFGGRGCDFVVNRV